MKHLIAAAVLALLSITAAAPARAVECDQLTSGVGVCLPRIGTDFDQWGTATIDAFRLLNGSAAVANSTTSVTRTGTLFVGTIAGLATRQGVSISSSVTVFSTATFTSAVGLAGSSLTLSGANGWISSASSITANAFFGGPATLSTMTVNGQITANNTILLNGDIANIGRIGGGTVILKTASDNVFRNSADTGIQMAGNATTGNFRFEHKRLYMSPSSTIAANGSIVISTGGVDDAGANILLDAAGTARFKDSIVVGSSVNASAFYGNGAGLSGVHSASTTFVPAAVGITATANSICYSTVTITTTGTNRLAVWFAGSLSNNDANQATVLGFLVNSAYVGSMSVSRGLMSSYNEDNLAASTGGNGSFHYITPSTYAAGTYSVCLTGFVTGGTGNINPRPDDSQFGAMELR